MAGADQEKSLIEKFSEDYRLGQATIIRELQGAVCGCADAGTSWTTQSEMLRVADLLGLRPGMRLLELGAGAGWPGLYLARESGCDIALVDLPLEGLRIAAERVAAAPPSGECWTALADGTALPFDDGAFDAVSHSDVLCCLDVKLAVLEACRRVIRAGGRMVFSVISVAPGLSGADYDRAVACGPPFVEAPATYPQLLQQAGWDLTHRIDLTAEYAGTLRQRIVEMEARASPLRELLGAAEFAEKLAGHRRTLGVIETRSLRRDLFVAAPTGTSPAFTSADAR